MPEDLKSASTGLNDLYFADDLKGTEFVLRELKVYEADEVSEPGKTPEFGRWIPALVNGNDVWLVGLGELIGELQRFDDPGELALKVTRCEKSGSAQTDPYEVNVEKAEAGQSRL